VSVRSFLGVAEDFTSVGRPMDLQVSSIHSWARCLVLGILFSFASWFSDADFAGCRVDRKSTSVTCQFLGSSLVSWSSRKQSSVAQSTTEAKYVAATRNAHSCFGSHTRWVTLVRSVPMYLSCVIARVPLVMPKTPCFTPEPNT
jgi:hypothetical protein